MNTKLTLSFDSLVIRKAKVFARKKNISLSKIVERYFMGLTENLKDLDYIDITDKDILKISGDIRLAEMISTDDLLSEQLIKKYIHD